MNTDQVHSLDEIKIVERNATAQYEFIHFVDYTATEEIKVNQDYIELALDYDLIEVDPTNNSTDKSHRRKQISTLFPITGSRNLDDTQVQIIDGRDTFGIFDLPYEEDEFQYLPSLEEKNPFE